MAEKTLKKKKKKSVESHGVAHIKSTFNNTHVTLTDRFGNVIVGRRQALLVLKAVERVQHMPQQ